MSDIAIRFYFSYPYYLPRPAPKRRAQQARQELYRGLIVEAAEAIFAESGVDGAKMEEIAEAAGLSLGTVYSVLQGKAGIIDALHEARLRDLLAAAVDAVRDLDEPLEMLIAGVRAYVEYFLAHPDYLRMYLAEGSSWGLPMAGRSIRAKAWEEGHTMQARLFRRGIETGVFHPGDPDRMARTMVAMQQVRLGDWLMGDLRETPDAIVAEMETQLRRSFCARAQDRETL
jgi:TetR/AcrR family transcriptional regulator